tara:strand:+ start:614 stop:886 length:273 start_codon:yes stop_codon:yes gene_type:complete
METEISNYLFVGLLFGGAIAVSYILGRRKGQADIINHLIQSELNATTEEIVKELQDRLDRAINQEEYMEALKYQKRIEKLKKNLKSKKNG